jgi:hypothetical protein
MASWKASKILDGYNRQCKTDYYVTGFFQVSEMSLMIKSQPRKCTIEDEEIAELLKSSKTKFLKNIERIKKVLKKYSPGKI